jgi:hypothetical protein
MATGNKIFLPLTDPIKKNRGQPLLVVQQGNDAGVALKRPSSG